MIMIQKINYSLCIGRNGAETQKGYLVHVEAYQAGRKIYFSTKIHLRKNQFSHGLVVNHPLADRYNTYLYKLRNEIEKVELDMISQGRRCTLAILKAAWHENVSISSTFRDFTLSVVSRSATRSQHTKDSYVTLTKVIDDFRPGTTIKDIDVDFINDFSYWQQSRGMSQSTISGRLKSIRAIINEAIARRIISADDNPFLHIKIPKIKSREEVLTANEVRRLERLHLKGKSAHIRDCALFGVYTGLRYHDLTTLTSNMIVRDRGKIWLVLEPAKTSRSSGVVVRLPLSTIFGGKAVSLIERYGSVEHLSHIGNNAAANRTLKEVIRRCGISDSRQITFHTMRHTFCTLLLAKGVPITTVAQLAGHTKIEQTQRYSHIARSMIAEDVKRAFK